FQFSVLGYAFTRLVFSTHFEPSNSLASLLSIHSIHPVTRYFPRTANLSRPRGLNAFAQLAPSTSAAVFRLRRAEWRERRCSAGICRREKGERRRHASPEGSRPASR